MKSGKKSLARKIVYSALNEIESKVKKPGIEIFNQAISNVAPTVILKSRRVGGANYQIPTELPSEKSQTLGLSFNTGLRRDPFLGHFCDCYLKSVVGKKVQDALRDLTFSNKRVSKEIQKTIHSAVANAENNLQYDIDKLFIKEAYTGKSIVMKRFRPRAKGRASPIKKPYSRLTIILSDKNEKKVEHGAKS